MEVVITIAIASYNNAPFIERCVTSVLGQSYSNLEIIIVDDGSTDQSLAIWEKYTTDSRVRLFRKENGGLASVRQLALNKATGKYICFIDADDYLEKDYVNKMYHKISKDKSNICVCSTRFEDEKGIILQSGTKWYMCKDSEEPLQTTPENLSNQALSPQLHLGDSWNKMYEVEFIKHSGVVFDMPKGLNGTDTLFNRLLAVHTPLYSTIKEPLYIHVIYASSAVHRKKKNLMETYALLAERTIEECTKIGLQDVYRQYVITKYTSGLYFVHVDVAKEAENDKSLREQFNEVYERHRCFVKKYPIKKREMLNGGRAMIKTFLFLFLYFRWSLPYFFHLRSIVGNG